jgi:hypothetical protein
MRSTAMRSSLFIAAFVALFMIAVPHAAHAQAAAFDNAACMKNLQAALYKGAQDQAVVRATVFSNVTVPRLNLTCLNNLMNLSMTLGTLTNPFNFIWPLIVTTVLQPLINAVCNVVTSAINAAVSFVKSLLCLPLPGFSGLHFNLGNFSGGSCSGIQLLPGLAVLTGPRAAVPGAWQIWNLNQ